MGYEAKILAIAKRIYNSFKFEQSEERIAMTELTKAYKEKINGDYISKEKIEIKINQLTDYEEQSALTMGIVPKMSTSQVIDMLAELLGDE